MTKQSSSAKSTNRSKRNPKTPSKSASAQPTPSKLDRLAALLARPGGASIAEMTDATGWQPHSVRGALAGALKRRGLVITSEKIDGIRRYRSGGAQ